MKRRTPGTNKHIAIAKVQKLIDHFQSDIVCIQDIYEQECKLGQSAREIVDAIEHQLDELKVPYRAIKKADVCRSLGLATHSTKYEVLEAAYAVMPELNFPLPQKRKIWEAENASTIILIAVGLLFSASNKP